MNRVDFQGLADVRIAEAAALLACGMADGAYYLAGYAVECALKACVAKLTKADEFPPDRKFVEKCYTHDFVKLLEVAGLKSQLDADIAINAQLGRIGTRSTCGKNPLATIGSRWLSLKNSTMRSQNPRTGC